MLVVAAGLCWILLRFVRPAPVLESSGATDASAMAPAIYALPPRNAYDFRNPEAVKQAVSFLESLQPTGTYILTTPGSDTIVPMDVAHAAIALTKVGQLSRA